MINAVIAAAIFVYLKLDWWWWSLLVVAFLLDDNLVVLKNAFKNMLSFFEGIIEVVNQTGVVGFINQSIAAIGITLGVLISFINVVARYVFDASFTWASELSIFLFIWSAFFGAAYCFKKDAHIAIDIVLELVPSKMAKGMLIVAHIITLVFLLSIAYFGVFYLELVIELEETSIDLGIPMWIPYLVIPVAFTLAGYRVFEKVIEIIKTPHKNVLKQSEAELIMAQMGVKQGEFINIDNENKEELLKEADKKSGGIV